MKFTVSGVTLLRPRSQMKGLVEFKIRRFYTGGPTNDQSVLPREEPKKAAMF